MIIYASPVSYTHLRSRTHEAVDSGKLSGTHGDTAKTFYIGSKTVSYTHLNKELLANHIRTCVADDIMNGKDEAIDELVVTLQKLMKLSLIHI